ARDDIIFSADVVSIAIIKDVDFSKPYTTTINGENMTFRFCNNNGICEPCEDGYCTLLENYATCPDCSSGSEDNYCDLQGDSICDPDCTSYDFDCEECLGNTCLYEGMEEDETTCASLQGTLCTEPRICEGYFTYADDTAGACCIGSCRSSEKKEASVPEDTSTAENTQEDNFDIQIFLYAGLIIVVLLVTVILVVVFESKQIRREHDVASYVYGLIRSGYSLEQIKSALMQQNIDNSIIEKIMRRYRK
ncbi:MAG: hypothetical protein ACOC32_01910, partial [Nanoarchaeota archaeon]